MKRLIIGGLLLLFLARGCGSSGDVTLHAATGNTFVQMFLTLDDTDNRVVRFDNGTHCTKVDGPNDYFVDSGPAMSFYILECNGTKGYVNASWVR